MQFLQCSVGLRLLRAAVAAVAAVAAAVVRPTLLCNKQAFTERGLTLFVLLRISITFILAVPARAVAPQ